MTVKTVNSADTRHHNVADFRLESLDGLYVADVEEALVGRLLTSSSDIPPCKRDTLNLPYFRDVQFNKIDADVDFSYSLTDDAESVNLKAEIVVPYTVFAFKVPLPLTPVKHQLHVLDGGVGRGGGGGGGGRRRRGIVRGRRRVICHARCGETAAL